LHYIKVKKKGCLDPLRQPASPARRARLCLVRFIIAGFACYTQKKLDLKKATRNLTLKKQAQPTEIYTAKAAVVEFVETSLS